MPVIAHTFLCNVSKDCFSQWLTHLSSVKSTNTNISSLWVSYMLEYEESSSVPPSPPPIPFPQWQVDMVLFFTSHVHACIHAYGLKWIILLQIERSGHVTMKWSWVLCQYWDHRLQFPQFLWMLCLVTVEALVVPYTDISYFQTVWVCNVGGGRGGGG